jgi:hypothetical protein
VHEGDVPGYAVSYRFHVVDPIRFRERIRVTIEHGHANHLADDWASTAYWYQMAPLTPVSIAPVATRLPTRPPAPPAVEPYDASTSMAGEVAGQREKLASRRRDFTAHLNQRYAQALERTALAEQQNRKDSLALKDRLG